MEALIKIFFVAHMSYLVSGLALPVESVQSTVPASIQLISTAHPIAFTLDSHPFHLKSDAFQAGANRHSLDSSSASNAIVKLNSMLPIQNETDAPRQQRIHVFRPLFVYRQEQEMRKRPTARPPIDPDRLYPYPSPPSSPSSPPSYTYDPYYYHHQHPQQHYAHSYYPDYYYEPYPHPYNADDYASNDILNAAEYWYPYH